MKKILSFLSLVVFAIILISCQDVNITTHTITEVMDAISIGYAEGDSADLVTENLSLPLASDLEKSATISWESNQVSVIDNFGTINRQPDDVAVTLTLSVTLGSDSVQKFFDVTVSGTIVRHTVSFNINGIISTIRVEDGNMITEPDDPGISSFRFLGWFSDSEKTTPFDFDVAVTQDLTIYASLQAIVEGDYSIEIYLENLDDETYFLSSTENLTEEVGSAIQIETTMTGFVLNEELSIISGNILSDSIVVLKGYFDRLDYTLNFYDGGNLLVSETLKYEELTTSIDDPTKAEYLFLGWSTSPISDTYYTFGEAITGNITLYAQWEISSSYTYEGYYEGADGLTENTLKLFLRTVVSTGIIGVNYGDARYILDETDADPNNSGKLILMYLGTSISGVWDGGTTWNREHVWPQSLLGVSASNSVINQASDLHNLKPADPGVNSSRGNKYFDNATTTTSYAPRNEVRGDIARILFYMTVRYSNLNLVNSTSPSVYQMAMLNTLLQWNIDDPVDSFEQNRNEVIYSYQKNRNPFIDHPEFAQKIWGSVTLSNNTSVFLQVETNSYLFMNDVIAIPQEVKRSYIC